MFISYVLCVQHDARHRGTQRKGQDDTVLVKSTNWLKSPVVIWRDTAVVMEDKKRHRKQEMEEAGRGVASGTHRVGRRERGVGSGVKMAGLG